MTQSIGEGTQPSIDPEGIREMYQALREFGYPLTEEYVRSVAEGLLQGKPPIGGPAMFIQGWLKKAGRLT